MSRPADPVDRSIPVALRARVQEICALTDEFCAAHLDDEYAMPPEVQAAARQRGLIPNVTSSCVPTPTSSSMSTATGASPPSPSSSPTPSASGDGR